MTEGKEKAGLDMQDQGQQYKDEIEDLKMRVTELQKEIDPLRERSNSIFCVLIISLIHEIIVIYLYPNILIISSYLKKALGIKGTL